MSAARTRGLFFSVSIISRCSPSDSYPEPLDGAPGCRDRAGSTARPRWRSHRTSHPVQRRADEPLHGLHAALRSGVHDRAARTGNGGELAPSCGVATPPERRSGNATSNTCENGLAKNASTMVSAIAAGREWRAPRESPRPETAEGEASRSGAAPHTTPRPHDPERDHPDASPRRARSGEADSAAATAISAMTHEIAASVSYSSRRAIRCATCAIPAAPGADQLRKAAGADHLHEAGVEERARETESRAENQQRMAAAAMPMKNGRSARDGWPPPGPPRRRRRRGPGS